MYEKINYWIRSPFPRQWNNQENGNTWETHHGKGKVGNIQENEGFTGAVQRPMGPEPYSTQAGNGTRDKKYKGRDVRNQTQNTAIQCSSNLWQGSRKNMPHLILKNY